MEPEFITYQKFNDVALANELAAQLEKHGIEHFVEEEVQHRPTTIFWAIKIKNEYFEKVNQLLKDDESEEVTEIGNDYYLFSFTDDELMDVMAKADEWSAFDVVLARKLLAERGNVISDETVSALNEKRIEKLKEPEPPQTFWIVVGYVLALLGGLLGIFIGWHLMSYKKTLPDGERVFDYTENDRKQGKRIFYISIVVLAILIIYKITTEVFLDND